MNIKVTNAIINYDVVGEGIPILLIHGFALDMHVMKGAYEPIFKNLKGFKRIYIDLPAMGQSKALNGLNSSQGILDAIIEFIDMTIDENFIVIGQSFGGYIAQAIINKIPERTLGLALLCPLVVADSDQRELPDHQLLLDNSKNIIYDNKENFDEFMSFSVIANQWTYDRFVSDILVGLNQGNDKLLEVIRMENYDLSPEPYESIKYYNKPSLIIVGRQDATVGYKDVMKLDSKFENMSLHILNGAGHSLQYEQEETFNVVTMDWLKSFI